MDNQTVIIIVSVISFIIIVIFGVKIFLEYRRFKKLTDNTIFPPWPAQCPDYWVSQNDNECKNINKIGICREPKRHGKRWFGQQVQGQSKSNF